MTTLMLQRPKTKTQLELTLRVGAMADLLWEADKLLTSSYVPQDMRFSDLPADHQLRYRHRAEEAVMASIGALDSRAIVRAVESVCHDHDIAHDYGPEACDQIRRMLDHAIREHSVQLARVYREELT